MRRSNLLNKGLLIVVIVAIGIMVGIENGFTAYVNNPMTEDLNAGGYQILNSPHVQATKITTQDPWSDARVWNGGAYNDTTITAALNAIGASQKTLLLAPGTWQISNSFTVPSNVNLRFEQGAVLNISATKTVTINGPIDAPLVQIVDGAGDVTFGFGMVKGIYPQWFGAKGKANSLDDDGPAFVAAAKAGKNSAIPTLVPPGYYFINSGEIDASFTGFKIIGSGSTSTRIDYNGTGYFINGNSATSPGYSDLEISGMTIYVRSTATGAIKLGDPSASYADSKWYTHPRLEDLDLQGGGTANSIGLNLTQIMRGKISHVIVNNFDICIKAFHVAETQFDNIRNSVGVSYGLYMKPAVNAPAWGMDGTNFKNMVVSGTPSGATAQIYLENVQDVSFDDIMIEDMAAHGVVSAVHTKNCAKIYVTNVVLSGYAGSTTKLFKFEDPREFVLANVRFGDLNITSNNGTVDVTYSAPTIAFGSLHGGVRLINCAYFINSLFSSIPRVQILSDGYMPGLSAYNRPIAGQTGLWQKQLLNKQGKSFLPETNYVYSAWHGQKFYQSGPPSTMVADSDCTGGYGISIPAGSGIGPSFLYPSEILPGNYEMIVRMKAISGTPDTSLFLNVDGTNIRYKTFTGSTSMKVFSYRIALTVGDIGAGTSVNFQVISAGGGILDYIAIRPAFNDITFDSYTAPDGGAQADASSGFRIVFGAAAPTSGAWNRGDICFNSAPTATGPLGWKCTVAGTPGTWVPFGGQAAAQADSTATTVTALKNDFNALLAKLRAAGLMAP